MTDPVKESFDKASLAMSKMNEDLESLKIKFGERSKIYLRTKDQFDAIVDMQAMASKEINELRKAYGLSMINQKAQELIIQALQSGLSEKQLIEWATR